MTFSELAGLPDEVVAVAASYDSTLRYGAQTPFSDQLAFQWEGSRWDYDAQHNSLVSAGNGGTKPTQAAFTIFYNQGAQKYELEQTLQPDEQMWIDIGKLIREHVPDKNGKSLPADLTSGSYEFRDLTNKGVGTLFEGKVIYDKTYGHVTYGCGGCCGYTNTPAWYNPLGIILSFTAPNGVNGWDTCTGKYWDVSGVFYNHWTTANGNIAAVDTYGTHTGMSLGSTTSSTWGNLNAYSARSCPILKKYSGGADNVATTPVFLQLVSSSCTTTVCQGNSWETNIYYRVLDRSQQPINAAGMVIKESVSKDTGTCHSTIDDSSQWLTDSTGSMGSPDSISTCASNTCSVSFTQSFTVNGIGVLLLTQDKSRSGSHNVINISCTNGKCGCPSVVISP